MPKVFGVSSFVMDSGERYCLVIDRSTDLPIYYPNLFLTTQLRNKSVAFSTIEAAAWNLVSLLRFIDRRGIDLERRLLKNDFLKTHELDALRDFCQRKWRKLSANSTSHSIFFSAEEIEDSLETVSNGTQYARLSTIGSYLRWLSMHLIVNPKADVVKQIETMELQVKERRPTKKGRNENVAEKSLDDSQIELLFEVIRPGSAANPFTLDVQRRNRLMILLLYHLGIRGGELLNIRIRDIDFSANHLDIVRRADERDDFRANEPNSKTLARKLPLSDLLAKELHGYISIDRRMTRNATRNDFLFVTHKEGKTVGHPISKAGYHKVIAVVRAVCPELYKLTGHKLRHTWNRMFSEKMDSMDIPPSEERQEQIRSYLNGWKPGSGTAATYNKRFIERKGQEAALSLQNSSGTRIPKGVE